MKREFKINAPTMPNFITYEAPQRKREDGPNFGGNTFPITDFTEEEAEEYGELMKQTFINHYKELKNK